jgi:hypothetical protein
MVTVVNRDVHGLVKEENQTKLSQTQNTDRLNQKLLAFNSNQTVLKFGSLGSYASEPNCPKIKELNCNYFFYVSNW